MAKGFCDDCDREGREPLRNIHPTGIPTSRYGSAQFWTIEHHSDGKGGLCPGSGKDIGTP